MPEEAGRIVKIWTEGELGCTWSSQGLFTVEISQMNKVKNHRQRIFSSLQIVGWSVDLGGVCSCIVLGWLVGLAGVWQVQDGQG